ncbi:MAG: hypothetical protein FWH12_09545 [Treponema sp.]|nr:hypothetical protein [Treponema sp.]
MSDEKDIIENGELNGQGFDAEGLSLLEDSLPGESGIEAVISGEEFEELIQNSPIYRLRLVYSQESFHAAWAGEPLSPGSMVLVPTRYGRDLAQIIGPIQKKAGQTPQSITRIERVANAEDLSKAAAHRDLEKEAYGICREKIRSHRMEMKLVSVHYLLEEPKILFFFTADSRVDFRDLVKDLVGVFKTRIELRQIGVRDESRVVGGLGVCGRAYCCHGVSDKLKPVSIKMAKDQNLSLNSLKISGPCGRLLCCLAYEHLFYSEQRRLSPPEGTRINWNGSTWVVGEVNIVMGKLKLSGEDGRVVQLPLSAFHKAEGRWTVTEAKTEQD